MKVLGKMAVGVDVHFVPHLELARLEGMDGYGCVAAKITKVVVEEERAYGDFQRQKVSLVIFFPNRVGFAVDVPDDPMGFKTPGTWHWPEEER